MTRPLRLQVENGHYHVTSRTWDRSALFSNDDDRQRFLDTVDRTVERCDWRCLAYCLMDNHFHLLVRTPLANLSRGMQRLNSSYAQWFNRRRGRHGPVLQQRFHGGLIQREPHLLEVHRYVALNPVRAGRCSAAYRYRWSSHAAILGIAPAPAFLAVGEVLDLFAAVGGGDGRTAYRSFVEADEPAPYDGPVHGDAEFIREAMRDVTREPEIARRDWTAGRPPLHELIDAAANGSTLSGAWRAHGYTMAAMAAHVGCHVSTISRRIAAHERAMLDCKI